jgi:plasmid maintenance system killer protein
MENAPALNETITESDPKLLKFFLTRDMWHVTARDDTDNPPAFRLHPLNGQMKGFWAVTVRANWRVIFRFAEGHAEDVDHVDYH